MQQCCIAKYFYATLIISSHRPLFTKNHVKS